MGILSGSLGQEFFEFCYNPVGEVSVYFALNIKENQKEGERKEFSNNCPANTGSYLISIFKFLLKPVSPSF